MPAISPAPYDPESKHLTALGDDERTARTKDINKRWQWYFGRHPDTLKVIPGKLNDNVKLNLCGRGVDRLIEFIGRPDAFVLDGPGADNDGATVAAMTALYDDQLLPLLPELELELLVAGHAVVKLWIAEDGVGECAMLDARLVTVYWRNGAGSRREPLWYRVQWADVDDKGNTISFRQDIVPRWMLDGGGDGWMIYDYELRGVRWSRVREDTWDYPFAPIVEFRNRIVPWEYYGQTQLTDDVIELNRAANFLATNTTRIIRYHAHPRTVAIGVKASAIEETSVDGMFTIHTPGASIQNLEMQSDLASSMAMLQQIKSEFFATMRVTDISSAKDRIGQVTNFGVRMLYSDMLEQIEEKRDTWGQTTGELLLRLCELNGVTLDRVPFPQWPDVLPSNRLEVLQAAQIEQALGVVSRETLAGELERTWEVERERLDDEGAAANAAAADALGRAAERGAFQ